MNLWETLTDWHAPSFALRVALGGVALSAAVLLAGRLLRRRSEPLRYGVLFAGVIGLLAVPLLVALGLRFQDTLVAMAPMEVEVVKIPEEMLDEFLHQPPPAEEPAEAASPATPAQMLAGSLLAIWVLGACIGAARLFLGLCKQRRALIGPVWQQPFWTAELKTQLAKKLGLRRFPEVRVSPAAPMPMVIGILRPTIVLPEKTPASWRQPQWEAVLLHEAAHIARWDPWAALVQHIAVVLFWWCPLVHVMARRLNELRESICDDCALQGQCDSVAYAELLVDSAERFLDSKPVPVPLGLLDSARSGLEARVLRLLEKERKPMVKLSFAGKLLGAGCLVAACLLTVAATAFSQAPPQAQKKVQIKILVDGKEIDLTDFDILKHIQAAQAKPDARPEVKVKVNVVKGEDGKGVAFSPDGKLIVSADGKMITILDAASGKIIAKHAHDGHAANIGFDVAQWIAKHHMVQEAKGGKTDPRIEELVKQAEAIKPGSGAEVRKALQGSQNMTFRFTVPPVAPVAPVPPVPGTHGARVWDIAGAGGKKIIIVIDESGKVQHLSEADLRKMLERGHAKIEVDKKVVEMKAKGKAIEIELKTPINVPAKKGERQPMTPPAADLEALSRQLERINAEIRDLRKRLEESKK